MQSFSALRLTLLRLCYLLLLVGLTLRYGSIVAAGDLASLPRMDGVVVALLTAMGLLSAIGLFSPVRTLPLLVFEIAWKAIWVLGVALPRWIDGTLDEGMLETLFACAWALPFVVIVPWAYVAKTYLRSSEPFARQTEAGRRI